MGLMCVEGNKNERTLGKGSRRELMSGVLPLAVFYLMAPLVSAQSTAPPPASNTLPESVRVAAGKRAEFRCGVRVLPGPPTNLTFTLYGHHGNYSLVCPGGRVEESTQALYGRCEGESAKLLAIWTINATTSSDNGTRVMCELPGLSATAAFLTVYDDPSNFAITIGCSVGGFLTTLLFFGVAFRVIKGSQRLQQCFRGKPQEVDDDMAMVSRK